MVRRHMSVAALGCEHTRWAAVACVGISTHQPWHHPVREPCVTSMACGQKAFWSRKRDPSLSRLKTSDHILT